MSPLFLLLAFLSLVLALPSPPVRRQLEQEDLDCSDGNICISRVFLEYGFARVSVTAFFNLTGTDPEKASDPDYEILEGKDDNIITKVEFGDPSPPAADHENIVFSTTVTFKDFPGRAKMRIFIRDSAGKLHSSTHLFEVMGLVLYEIQGDQPHILTGRNPNRTVVRAQVREQNGGGFGTTVNVSIFQGDPTSTPADPQDIRLIVGKHSEVLPWNAKDCPIVAEPSSLGARCSMGFSVDFKHFSVRIPPGREIPSEIPVQFEWVGIREYEKRIIGESNVGSTDDPNFLESDIITSIIITERASPRDNAAAPLAGWKIGVIAITSVLLVIASITLVCCYFCGRKRSPKKPEPDVIGFKDKFQEIGFLRRSTLRRGDDDGDDDQCYVEEPPTPEGSEILMLENESRGHARSGEDHIEGLIPTDRPNEDKSVERLVLPPGVVRGVELESSTEGASAFGYGSQSGENDVTSYGRGMTSVPRDQFTKPREYRASRDRSPVASRRSGSERGRDPDYFRDSHERIRSLERDRARIREMDREIERERSARERSEERMRPRLSEEEFPNSGPVIDDRTNGVASRSRGGVGAAINRIRQLDLLNGPASRGLVGRNGEPIQTQGGEGRSRGGNVIEVSGSALS